MKVSSIQFCLVAAMTATAVGGSTSAQAGGDLGGRPLSSSSVAKCPSGLSLRERVWYYANAYGWSEELGVACLLDKNTAKWALVAATVCDDEVAPAANPQPSICFGKEAARYPSLFYGAGVLDDRSHQRPPFSATYSAVKYAIGNDCHLVTTDTDPAVPEYYSNAWRCRSLDVVDGSRGKAGREIIDPSQVSVRHISSVSDSLFIVDDSSSIPDTVGPNEVAQIDEGRIPMSFFGVDDTKITYDITPSLKAALASEAGASPAH